MAGPSTRRLLVTYAFTILSAVFLAVFIRNFVLETFRIPSMAMYPSLLPGDTVFVTKWPYSYLRLKKDLLSGPGTKKILTRLLPDISTTSLNYGDIVLFSDFSQNHEQVYFIKRVIGLPGDWITVDHGKVTRNGQILPVNAEEDPSEAPSFEKKQRVSPLNFRKTQIDPGHFFVFGDYQASLPNASNQERDGWGIISSSSILGVAKWIGLSIGSNTSDPPKKIRWTRFFRSIK